MHSTFWESLFCFLKLILQNIFIFLLGDTIDVFVQVKDSILVYCFAFFPLVLKLVVLYHVHNHLKNITWHIWFYNMLNYVLKISPDTSPILYCSLGPLEIHMTGLRPQERHSAKQQQDHWQANFLANRLCPCIQLADTESMVTKVAKYVLVYFSSFVINNQYFPC